MRWGFKKSRKAPKNPLPTLQNKSRFSRGGIGLTDSGGAGGETNVAEASEGGKTLSDEYLQGDVGKKTERPNIFKNANHKKPDR